MSTALPTPRESLPSVETTTDFRTSLSAARVDFLFADLIVGLRGRRNLTERQREFMRLADQVRRTAEEELQFHALGVAEGGATKGVLAAVAVSKSLRAGRQKARDGRNAALREVAELLEQAGLVDAESGLPLWDRGELLGALIELANSPVPQEIRAAWKRAGDDALARHEQGAAL